MARDRKDLGARKFVRVDLRKPGFLIPAPDAPWIQCYVLDISDNGACLDVGDLAVPKMFGLSLTAGRRGAAGLRADLAQGRSGRRPVYLRPGAAERRCTGR